MGQRLQPVLRPGTSWFIHALVVLFSLLSAPAVGQAVEHGHQQDRQQDISEDNIKRHLTYSADCEININSLEYFDFTGDGVDEAVVVASTCATGTAGPDIHAVFTRQPDGTLAELKIHAPTENLGDLLGRVFYDLNVKDGLPKGFVRIRHFGFLAHRRRATFLPLCLQLLGAAPPSQTEPKASPTQEPSPLWLCPKCGGHMVVIERLTAAQIQLRSPPSLAGVAA